MIREFQLPWLHVILCYCGKRITKKNIGNLTYCMLLTLIPTAPKVYRFFTGCVLYVPTFLWLINNMIHHKDFYKLIRHFALLFRPQTCQINFKYIFQILISRQFLWYQIQLCRPRNYHLNPEKLSEWFLPVSGDKMLLAYHFHVFQWLLLSTE